MLSESIRKHGSEVWKQEVLEEFESQEDAKSGEVKWIARLNTNALKGGVGYNMTDGGDGCVLSGENNPFYGRKHSPESIEKMRQTLGDKLSGENNPQFGLRGELSPSWGCKHSEESKQKRSEKLRGRPRTEEAKLNMRIASQNPETRERRSQAQKARRQREHDEGFKTRKRGPTKPLTQEHREKISQRLKGLKRSDEFRQQASERMKKRWAERRAQDESVHQSTSD